MHPFKEFGTLLKKYRREHKLIQDDLADGCGVSQGLISQLETGKSKPSAAVLACLSRTLQLTSEQRSRLFVAAGYVEDNNGTVSEIVAPPDFRSVLALLSDPMVNRLPGPLAREAVRDFAEGWHLYAQAKAKQYNREWQEADEICDTAVIKLQQAANQLQAYLMDAQGSAALHRGHLVEAERRFQDAELLVRHVNDPYLEGQLLAHQGELLRFRSEWRQAEEKFQAANKAFLNLSSSEARTKCAWVDKKIGMLYLMQDQWDQALRYLRHSEVVFRESDNTYELAKTCLSLGWAYTQAGDWHQAITYRLRGYRLTQSHRVMGQQPDHYLRMQGHVYLGLSLHQLGFLDEAQQQLEAAKTISDSLEEMHERSTILIGLAHLYHDKYVRAASQDNALFKIAETYCQTAAQETHAAGDKYRFGRTLIYQAQLYLDPDRANLAIELLQDAQRILRVLEHRYFLSSIAIFLGRAYLIKGRIENLHVCVDEGIKDALVYTYPYQRQLSELRVLKARAYCQDGELEETAKQLAYALAAAVLYNRFQCEKIADQLIEAIECSQPLKKGYSNWGRLVQSTFAERFARNSQSQELSNEQEKLVEDVLSWLEKLRRDPTLVFSKRAKQDIQPLLKGMVSLTP